MKVFWNTEELFPKGLLENDSTRFLLEAVWREIKFMGVLEFGFVDVVAHLVGVSKTDVTCVAHIEVVTIYMIDINVNILGLFDAFNNTPWIHPANHFQVKCFSAVH